MSAFERNLQRVLAHERDVLHPKLVGVQVLDAREASGRTGLAAALGARARPAKSLGRVTASVPVFPRDDHDLALTVDVDGQWKRIGVFQIGVTGR